MIKVLTSFLVVGIICMIASLIYDMTKLTPGHITSLFVVAGTILGLFGTYDILLDRFGYGLSLPITSFGNNLIKSAYEGFHDGGLYGILSNMFVTTSAGISATIIFSFFISIFCKPKD